MWVPKTNKNPCEIGESQPFEILEGGLLVWLRYFNPHDHTIYFLVQTKNRKFIMKIPLILTGCFIDTRLICLASCESVQRFLLVISS